MKMKLLYILLLVFYSFTFVACSANLTNNNLSNEVSLYADSCTIDSDTGNDTWQFSGIAERNSHTGKYISHTEKGNQFGICYSSKIPAPIQGHNVKLVVDAYVRTSDTNYCGNFVVTVMHHDSVLFYGGIQNKKFIHQNNEWSHVIDTVVLPMALMQNNENSFKIYLYNPEEKSSIDVDDISIKFFDFLIPSYLPKLSEVTVEKGEHKILWENKYYKISYNEKHGLLQIADSKNERLTKQIVYFLEYKNQRKDKNSTKVQINKFDYQGNSDSSISFKIKVKEAEIAVDLFIKKDSPKMEIRSKSTFKKTLYIVRESFVFEMNDAVAEVYRNNRKVDVAPFQKEYWIDKEGVKFGVGNRSVYFYHNTNISSAQINTTDKSLIVNLDYAYDHLLMHFPLRKDTIKGIKEDLSNNFYSKGSSTSSEFALYFGEEAGSLPRFMKNPYGFLSAFIFTEHADYTDLRTQYAVNYGSEEIHEYTKATGGFAKYNLPVTKSIFYNNPENTNNSAFNKDFNTPICALKSTPNFESFIDDLYNHGYEITLHTPDQNTTTAKNLEEAIAYFANKYNTTTWIDHGYDNGAKDNREDFVCDGLKKESPQYALDYWKKYNTRYFWNCYFEDSVIFPNSSFSNNLKNVYYGFGDLFPTPDYWAHKTAGANIYSWPSHQLLLNKDVGLWDYLFDEKRIYELVESQEIVINHSYPSRIDPGTAFYFLNEKGKYVITPEFDKVLQKLADFRNRNLLNITTIKQFMDYRLALENVKYQILGGNRIKITNQNNTKIGGLSMAIKANEIMVEGKKITRKRNMQDIIFWFDLLPSESIILEYK